MLAWWQRIWPTISYSRIIAFLAKHCEVNRSELRVCLDIRKRKAETSLFCSWLFFFFQEGNIFLCCGWGFLWIDRLIRCSPVPSQPLFAEHWEGFSWFYFLPVRAASKPWGKGSSFAEYKVSPSRVRRLLASPSGGSQFPISFLLARCCHLHSHWAPPSHANNPMAINRAVHGRQRKKDTLTPVLLYARVLDRQIGEQGGTRASHEGTPGTGQLPTWSRGELLSVWPKLFLLQESGSLGLVYMGSNSTKGAPRPLSSDGGENRV